MPMSIKHSGVWKEAEVHVKHQGIWKRAEVWVKQSGVWKMVSAVDTAVFTPTGGARPGSPEPTNVSAV